MAYRFVEPRIRVGDGITSFGGAKLYFFDIGTSNPKTTYSDFALSVANADPVVADADGLFGDIFLNINADVTLKSSTDVTIYGPISIYAPEDTVLALAASLVSVLDTAGDFTGTNVETVLTEISDNFGKLTRINTWSAIQTFTAALQMSDQEVRRPLLLDYAIKHVDLTQSTGTIDLDMNTGNSFAVTLTENATITISNPPATGKYGQLTVKIIQDGAGGAYTVTWPAAVKWPSGSAPTMTVSNDAIDEFSLRTTDAGTQYRGSFSQAYA
ncbi:MAG: hypothetical protein ACKVKT_03240 [Rhodospirillales bacterium]